MNRKHNNVCSNLNHIEDFRYLASSVIGFISISAFAYFLGILIGIIISAIGLKIFAKTTGTKKYKSIIKNKKKHDKTVK